MELKILSPLYGGMGLAKGDQVFFVKGGIPGETVEARVIEKKRDYTVTEATDILHPSALRQEPPCPVYGDCGGCHYQHIDYQGQLSMKQEIICDCFKRIGKMEGLHFEEAVYGDQFRYRYRGQFKVNDGQVGFYRENTHEIVQFDSCLLLDDILNDSLRKMKAIDFPSSVREITLTVSEDVIAYVPSETVSRDFLLKLIEHGVAAGVVAGNGETAGKQFVEFTLGSLTYTVSARSFFQSNWALNDRLSDLIAETISPVSMKAVSNAQSPASRVEKRGALLDVFGGAGNFSLPLSNMFRKITVIEENPFSIEDGIRNAERNGIHNIRFIQSSAEEMKVRGKYDVVIVDPPRVGLTNRTMKKVLEIAPEEVLYISCNPATLARDAAKLGDMYSLGAVRLIDMFPQTFHCEIFCHFILK